MQIIGFNLTKIHAEKSPDFKQAGMNTQIEFTNIEKEKIPFVTDDESYKLSFHYALTYGEDEKEKGSKKYGEVTFDGIVVITLKKDEAKLLTKSWKKKQVPEGMILPLYNFILRKCSAKSLSLEEDINLPYHLQIPQLKRQPKSE